ncbi:MAG TPA: hypothetical protein VN829_01110 [Dongiaceae bacterium]|nr:hypothetical protein [Dongiaceae bacterium]
MGRSYWFECSKCGYRVKVSGRADRGVNVFVQTIHCRECRELLDVVTRIRIPDEVRERARPSAYATGSPGRKLPAQSWAANGPPSFQAALGRLTRTGSTRFRWLDFRLRCPVSPSHSVQGWSDPGKCPKCGVFLEKNGVPYRIWE